MFKIYKKNQTSNTITNITKNNNTVETNKDNKKKIFLLNQNRNRNCQSLKFVGNVKCGTCGGVR